MKVLSLFDGMACGMLAMQKACIEVDRYVAYEIDKYAVQTATHNFPMIEQRGDVFQADFTEYSGFDFLIGGSPCTYWSIAQKNNRETEASGMGWELFSQYVRALHESKPKFFVYENNKSMSKAIRESIDKAFGFEAIGINSALVSAQNRQRLYWVGKRNEDGTYSKVPIEQPEDRGILLKDILETGQPLSQNDKSYALTTRCCGAIPSDTLSRRRHSMVAEPCAPKELTDREIDYMFRTPERTNYGYIQRSTDDKAKCITANIAKGVPYNCMFEQINPKSPPYYANPCEWDAEGKPVKATSAADGKTYMVYEVKGGLITIKGKQYSIKLADGYYIIRKLTVRECMRLQTVPEWYAFPVSDSQAYKMLGNGWTCRVIEHLLRGCMADGDADDWML